MNRRFLMCALLALGSETVAVANSPTPDQKQIAAPATPAKAEPSQQIVIDINNQRLFVFEDGKKKEAFRVSTSRFGLGDGFNSFKTPLGAFQICDKLGDNAPLGAVFKRGHFTGEILRPNAPGRDPMVTRIIRLQGLEAQNRHALARGIYIHGTPEEREIGRPVSWGCIRMRSKDVVELFNQVKVGTHVEIIDKKAEQQQKTPEVSTGTGWFS